jgi:hypothetical protein
MDDGVESDLEGRYRLAAGMARAGERRERPRPRDPLADTDALGLRKFNIGLVPASVTPPRTWKRAAWFAVLSSVAVLVGLGFAAMVLVGATNPAERIGMPGYPDNVPILTGFAEPTTTPPVTNSRRAGLPEAPEGVLGPVGGGGVGGVVDAGVAGTTPPLPLPTLPQVTTVPSLDKPAVDPGTIAKRTQWFYEELATNADTALVIATDTFRTSGEAVLEQRFADVARIQVRQIAVDPAKGITVSTLHLTKKDGTTATERRELVFTLGLEPLISAERPAGTTSQS